MTSMGILAINRFYLAFKNDRPCWPLIICALLFGLIAIAGLIFNFLLIFVTARSKSLHGTANFLLALTSMFELFHQSGHFLFVYTAFSGLNFIEYRLAIHLSTLSLFGLFGLNLSMFFTGLDRFICVIFPILYRRIESWFWRYLGTLFLICTTSSAFITFLFYLNAEDLRGFMVTGTLGDLLRDDAGSFYIKYTLSANVCTIALYIITGIALCARPDQFHRRIFRSLVAIVSLNVGGYFLMSLFLFFVFPPLEPSFPVQIWFIRSLLGVFLLNVSASSNGPILCWTSTDYRKAFRTELARLIKAFKRNQIQPIQVEPRADNNNYYYNHNMTRKSIIKMSSRPSF